MEKLQFETSKFLFAGMGTLEIVPENIKSKFVFKDLRESGISKFQKTWILSQNFDLVPTYGICLRWRSSTRQEFSYKRIINHKICQHHQNFQNVA